MFRKPRENVPGTTNVVKPLVGRPPSPPSTPNYTSFLSAAPESKPDMAMKTAASRSAPPKLSSPQVSQASRGIAKIGKSTAERNGNIMNFFKKVERDDANNGAYESLFVDDGSPRKQLLSADHIDLVEASVSRSYAGSEAEESDIRFNESSVPSKRRKTSHSPDIKLENGDLYNAPAHVLMDGDQSKLSPDVHIISDNFAITTQKHLARRIGPFLEDSDSEKEELEQARERTATQVVLQETSGDRLSAERNSHIAVKEEEAYPNSVATLQSYPPQLKRESTSYPEEDGFADFEGLEDFDDEYAEGEEFVERRWMQNERRLEMENGNFEGELDEEGVGDEGDFFENGVNDEHLANPETQLDSTAGACPICNVSFVGISDQDVSVHVNHCLDGNPTPLPTPSPVAVITQPIINAEPPPTSAKFRRPARPSKPGQENPFTLGSANGTSSAFSKLMSGHAEDAAWATAAAAEHASRGKPAFQRTCPFYKILPGFYICVDAFRYGAVQGCNAYFLSHFHSDHYIGLTSTWNHGPIYCSRATGNLVRQQLRVDPKWVVDLKFDEKVEVPGTQGVSVTMIPANHCPGSSLYLFEKVVGKGKNPKVQRVLHCGDFRACPAHVEHPLLRPDVMDSITGKTAQQKIDVCYLDTTYLNPKYAFPSQEDVIQACADMCVSLSKAKVDADDGWEQMKKDRAGSTMANFVRKDSGDGGKGSGPHTDTEAPNDANRGQLLVVVGTYSIGKERICLGIARALNSKIYAPPGKQRICACLEDPELNARLTSDPRAAQVHMTPLFEIRAETLGDYLAEYRDRFSRCVGFRPSGWNYRPPGSRFTESPAVGTVLYSDNWKSGYSMRELVPQRGSTSRAACYGVPYSEHSSFRELSMFCCALRIEKIVPTVNVGSAKGREKMKLWCERWAVERKKNGLFKVGRDADGKSRWYAGKGTWDLRTTL